MQTITGHGIKLSTSGRARQLIILCHGGWKPLVRKAGFGWRQSGDHAATAVPGGSRLFFYSADGQSETGFSVLQEVMLRPAAAFDGLQPRPGISAPELMALNRALLPSDLASNLQVVEEAAGGPGQLAPKDYALYHHAGVVEHFAKHERGEYDEDVDMAMPDGPGHKRHLSDVFALTASMHYPVYHYAACRVRR